MNCNDVTLETDVKIDLTHTELMTIQALAVVNNCTVDEMITKIIRRFIKLMQFSFLPLHKGLYKYCDVCLLHIE